MNFLLTGNIQKTDASGNHLESQFNSNVVEDESETPTNAFVDKLTMEYMMNRTHYKKYLAKTDTNKYQRLNEQLLYIQSHEEDIEEITSNLLQDFIRHGNFTKYNTIINTAFEEFLYTCVGYIKDTEYNNKNTDENI
uniref:Uncharacterized protein n=1 Tax=viral metagenome TaxID=1070528 RepID=A0A6C0ICJ2_9ZZZZ